MWTAVQQKPPSSYAGQVDKAVHVATSFEQLAHEANGLLEAATLLSRLSKSQKDPVECQ